MAELIQKNFGENCNLYDILGVSKNATNDELKKGYKKMALKCHPDKRRHDANATEKFQALAMVHSILSDKELRENYDQTGEIEVDESMISDESCTMWEEYWRRLFPKITVEDILTFEKSYKYSEEEKEDVINAYKKFEGDLEKMMDVIMLSVDDDEARFIEIINFAISDKKVKAYQKFVDAAKKVNITKKKSKRKLAKEAKEAKEAEELRKLIQSKNSAPRGSELSSIASQRKKQNNSFISQLEQKYSKKPIKGVSKKRTTEATEEEFLAIQKRLLKKKK